MKGLNNLANVVHDVNYTPSAGAVSTSCGIRRTRREAGSRQLVAGCASAQQPFQGRQLVPEQRQMAGSVLGRCQGEFRDLPQRLPSSQLL